MTRAAFGVSAVVINYNAASVLADCVRSLRAEGIEQLVVVDNDSADDSRRALSAADPDAVWVSSGGNIGYGAAANLGAARTSGPAVLVCNPDVVVLPGAVAALVDALQADPRAGIVAPRLLNPDGSVYPSARSFPSLVDAVGHGLLGSVWPGNPFSRRYKLLDWDHRDERWVDWVSGACLLVRRRTWDDVGGFDGSFFMYMEDVDLCWRVGRAGWGIVYEAAADVVHAQGVSTNTVPYRMILAHHRSMWRFGCRTMTGWRRTLLPVIGAGLAARAGLACLEHRQDVRRGPDRQRRRGRSGKPLD